MANSQTSEGSSPRIGDETRSVTGAAGVIGAATLSSRVLGFIRDILLAQLFGATASADAFYVAYRIPNLLRELFAEGSMSSAFIPVFTEYHTLRTKQETWELASAVFTTLLSIVTGVTLIGILAAPGIVWILAPGFRVDAAQLATTTLLAQVMFPYLVFVSLAALAMGILNSLRAFAVPALTPVFLNVCIIVFALFVSPILEEPILGVAAGVVVGGIAQFVMQLPALRRRGFSFGWLFKPGHPGVRRIGLLIVPTLLGMSVTQINLTVSTVLASFFPGGPTYLYYGMRLIQFPLGIFGAALGTALLPTLSAQAARGDLDQLRGMVNYGLRMLLFIIVPSMAGLMLLREPIVHLFFEHGAFSARDTAGTSAAVLAYATGLWAFSGNRILNSAFYSLQDTKTPALTAILGVVTNLTLALVLMDPLGHVGLALATAVAAMVNTGLLLVFLTRRLGGLEWKAIARAMGRNVMALLPVLLASLWVAQLAVWSREGEWVAKAIMLLVGIGLSATGYIGVHALCRSEELESSWSAIKAKIRLA